MKLKFITTLLALVVSYWSQAQKSEAVLAYINNYKELAILEMQRTGIPASITLAQGIHETEAGQSDLVLKSNNHFGIKCKSDWSGDKVYHDDDARGECFRSYASAGDSYIDHSNFLKTSPRYASLFSLDPTDYKAWADGLKKAGYATNTRYSAILIKLIEDYDLQHYSLIAMGILPAGNEIWAAAKKGAGEPILTAEPQITEKPTRPKTQYPGGEFIINRTRVVYAKAGTSLLAVAEQYNIDLGRLLDFNDLGKEEVLVEDQLLFLQRKRKMGANDFHIVQSGEDLYSIGQLEGMRLDNLRTFNHLRGKNEPAVGEKLYLQTKAPEAPKLAEELTLNERYETPAGIKDNATINITTHIVQPSETLFTIAKKYGVELIKIREWNKLTNNTLKAGQELIIYKN